jgi:hypothetical protein
VARWLRGSISSYAIGDATEVWRLSTAQALAVASVGGAAGSSAAFEGRIMSASGHKRTYALQKVMSALPPIADMALRPANR